MEIKKSLEQKSSVSLNNMFFVESEIFSAFQFKLDLLFIFEVIESMCDLECT